MRILFIASSRLADAVVSCGVLEQLRTSYPRARITVACGTRTAGLFSRLPKLERVVIASRGDGKHYHRLRLWSKLVGKYWDVAVDMRGSNITRFLRTGRCNIIRIEAPGTRYKQLGEAMGFSPAPLPVTWSAAADFEEAERRLPAGSLMIGLGPTASSQRKTWPAERFTETLEALTKIAPGCRAVIFAGAGESELRAALALQTQLPGAICLSASLGLPVLAACMSRLGLFIGNDNGLLHLAAAAGTPTLALFGRNRGQSAPAGRHTAAVFASGPRGDTQLGSLTVEAVLAAAVPLLQASPFPR